MFLYAAFAYGTITDVHDPHDFTLCKFMYVQLIYEKRLNQVQCFCYFLLKSHDCGLSPMIISEFL